MSSLSDRYVHAVTEQLPEDSREDVARELRATIEDAVEARDPDVSPEAAERAAVIGLGHPERLADEYRGAPRYVIGPRYYAQWKRILVLLLWIVPPIAAALAIIGELVDQGALVTTGVAGAVRSVSGVITAGISAALTAVLQVAAWTTLGFAIAERSDTGGRAAEGDRVTTRTWDPDRLPEPARRQVTWGDTAVELIGYAIGIALLSLAPNPPAFVDGGRFPTFTDAAWSMRWVAVALLVAFVIVEVMIATRGRWSRPLAGANAVLNTAFAGLAAWLFLVDGAVTPQVDAALSSAMPGVWQKVVVAIVVVVCLWDSVAAFRKASRAQR